jgi:hypothetical protein
MLFKHASERRQFAGAVTPDFWGGISEVRSALKQQV